MEDLVFFVASEDDFNEIISGQAPGPGYPWDLGAARPRIGRAEFGVLCSYLPTGENRVRPHAIVVNESDQNRLFARFSQLRADLSPLSTWLHIFTPDQFHRLSELLVVPNLNGFEAAWTGMIVAEATILAKRPAGQLKLVACLATPSFAVARSTAIWSVGSYSNVLQIYDRTQKDVRGIDTSSAKLRGAFNPIWNALRALCGAPSALSRDEDILVQTFLGVKRARDMSLDFVETVRDSLWVLPEASILSDFDNLSPELRLREFDRLIGLIGQSKNETGRRLLLSFLAAFIATVAAGGASSLTIAEQAAEDNPEVLALAYIIGGLGEFRSWAGAFDGLGRLVSRELLRTFHVLDGPESDFAAVEASTLVDKQLNDPLVFLKLKQSRVATAALSPGVNVQVPFNEIFEPTRQKPSVRPPVQQADFDPLAALADALAPYLKDRLAGTSSDTEGGARVNRKGARKGKLA